MKEVVLGIWLGIQAGIDFKYKEIPLLSSLIAACVGLGFCIIEGRGLEDIILSLLPGIVCLCISKLTKEVIGYGDGIILSVMGLFCPLEELIEIGMLAFLIAGCIALILLVFFKKGGNYRMPFVPFLFLAFVVACFSNGGMRV